MSRILRVAAIAAAALAAGPAASAQAHSSFSGIVINCLHGAPVANAPVALDAAGRSGRAGADGRFTFYNLPDSQWNVVRASAVHGTYGAMTGASGPYWLVHGSAQSDVVIRPAQRWRCLPHLQ